MDKCGHSGGQHVSLAEYFLLHSSANVLVFCFNVKAMNDTAQIIDKATAIPAEKRHITNEAVEKRGEACKNP